MPNPILRSKSGVKVQCLLEVEDKSCAILNQGFETIQMEIPRDNHFEAPAKDQVCSGQTSELGSERRR